MRNPFAARFSLLHFGGVILMEESVPRSALGLESYRFQCQLRMLLRLYAVR